MNKYEKKQKQSKRISPGDHFTVYNAPVKLTVNGLNENLGNPRPPVAGTTSDGHTDCCARRLMIAGPGLASP